MLTFLSFSVCLFVCLFIYGICLNRIARLYNSVLIDMHICGTVYPYDGLYILFTYAQYNMTDRAHTAILYIFNIINKQINPFSLESLFFFFFFEEYIKRFYSRRFFLYANIICCVSVADKASAFKQINEAKLTVDQSKHNLNRYKT